MGVAGLGDRAPVLARPARVLRGNQAGERHKLGGRGEPVEVAHLRGDGHRREGVDPAEAPELRHRGLERWSGAGGDLGVDRPELDPAGVEAAT